MTSTITNTLAQLVVGAYILAALIALALLLYIWNKWQNLGGWQRVLVATAVGLVTLVATNGVAESWAWTTTTVSTAYSRFDTFTRDHQWVGLAMLCMLPLLMWPRDEETRNVDRFTD